MSLQSQSVAAWPSTLLAGRVAVVTGATSGIGHACALALARAGADLVVNCRPGHEDKGAAVKTEIEALGREALSVPADVRREADVEHLVGSACRHFGTIHLMLANAGIQRDAPLIDMSLAQWQEVIDVNLTGQFLCARAAAREFLRRGIDPARSPSAGGIICMSSVHDVIPWAGHVNYAASKGGVALMMRSLAQELAPRRVRVNAISPGAIRTPINREAWETPEAERRLLELIPYGRVGEGTDVANAAVWLASDLSDYVTGATLYVDGGMTLYPGFADNG
jgi:glucose 1-dehydrogenase